MYLCCNKYKYMRKLLTLLLICIFSTSIAQNGKFIGQVITNPVPAGQSINFNIMSGNIGTAFKIDAKTGDMFINNQTAIDANTSWRYMLVIRLRYSQNGVILADTMRTIRVLNVVNNKSVGIFVATDPDTKQKQKLSYYFMSGNYNTAYKISNTGNISVSNASAINIRAPTTDRYVLNVRVRDNGVPNLTTYANATILLWGGLPKRDVFNCRYP